MFSYCLVGLSVRSLFCFTVLCIPSGFAIISLGKRELISLLLLCCECHDTGYRSLTLLRGAMGWSVVCDCGISWSYSFTSEVNHFLMNH